MRSRRISFPLVTLERAKRSDRVSKNKTVTLAQEILSLTLQNDKKEILLLMIINF